LKNRRKVPFPFALPLIPLLVVASSCDIPTDSPQWEQRWIFPGDDTSLGVDELLPDDVTLTPDQSAFTVQVDPVSFEESLGNLCQACTPLDGQTAPKPPFQNDFDEIVSLPDQVVAAELRLGRVVVVAQHDLGFDPIRPPGGATGSLSMALRDGGPGGPVLDQVTVNGAETSFGPGEILTRTLEYSGPVSPEIWVTMSVDSPAGGLGAEHWVTVSLVDRIQVTATPTILEASSALVDVAGETFDLIETDLDVEDLDDELVDHVVSGAFILDIVNPWSLGASFTLTIDGPTMGPAITKLVTVPATPASTVRVEFTQSELQSFLGEPSVTMTGSGTVAPGTGPVTLEPGQTLTVDTSIDLVVLVG
jgi:hypothetical protein